MHTIAKQSLSLTSFPSDKELHMFVFFFVCLFVCLFFVCLFVLSHLLRIEVVLEVAISPPCCTPVHVVNCKQTFCLFYLHRKIITTYLTLK